MLYKYDQAVAEDLRKSIDADSGANDIVKVMEADGILALIAQMKEDKVKFPLICVVRHSDVSVDTTLANFTRLHKGLPVTYDDEKHDVYFEKSIPIKLEYDLVILGTNTADVDELVREVLFKYTNVYFLSMELPYESNRTVRFGVTISGDVSRESGSFNYISGGALYQAIVPLRCEGAVLYSYTPRHITRFEENTEVKAVKDLK